MHIPPGEVPRTGGVGVDRITRHYARVAAEVRFGLGWHGGKCLPQSGAGGEKWDSQEPPHHHHLWWGLRLVGKSM